jgi:glutaredoxin/glutathione-dependent peroxiredoxin
LPDAPDARGHDGVCGWQKSRHFRFARRLHAHLFVAACARLSENVGDKIRMLGDGSAAFTKAMGLELDLTAKGMGVRCQRFSLLVDNGVVKQVNIEGVGAPNCSFAENMLAQLG